MNDKFLSEIESNTHKQTKAKLYTMLCNDLKVIDQYNMNYKYDESNLPEEFLHIESPILNFKNSVLYSNNKTKLPCYKYLGFNYTKNKNLLCNQKGVYGNISELPCKNCIKINVNNKSSIIGYTPDIAYGQNGKHLVWFEINHTHPSTVNKLYFCYINNIKLFEFESGYILNIDNQKDKIRAKRYSIISDDENNKLCQEIKLDILQGIINQFINITALKIIYKDHKILEIYFNKIVKEYNIDLSQINIKGFF